MGEGGGCSWQSYSLGWKKKGIYPLNYIPLKLLALHWNNFTVKTLGVPIGPTKVSRQGKDLL